MNYSKQVLDKAREIVSNYNNFDELLNLYTLDINYIIDSPLMEKLSGLLLADNPCFAVECMSYHNSNFKDVFIPSLIGKMINDEESYENVCNDLITSIIKYQLPIMKDLFDSILDEYNENFGDKL